ncbi:MAG: YifB family Mg chelatase-like AAA ATPase [Myxococcales bacterium]
MPLASIKTATLQGLEATPVFVEVDMAAGMPYFDLVGLAETSVRESRVRVQAAIRNSGITLPQKRITVSLAPANVRKEGSGFDLPIALGILTAAGLLDPEASSARLFIGELSLTGEVRSVPGVLALAVMARARGCTEVVVPAGNAGEAAVVRPLDVRAATHLGQVLAWLRREGDLPLRRPTADPPGARSDAARADFQDVLGQEHAKRALEIAAAGGHNVLMVGPPGAGKTMLARRLPGILPQMGFEEALETTLVYSVLGRLTESDPWIADRPFRAPHHSASDVGIIGGGPNPRPGEISLAHNGVLFLDEMPEFHRNVLECLRQPLEERRVSVARAQGSFTFPASFMLVAAMNPCPCGRMGDVAATCLCSLPQTERYRAKVSQPLLDRLDLHVELPALDLKAALGAGPGERSEVIRQRVSAARERQLCRFAGLQGTFCNAQIPAQSTAAFVPLQPAAARLLEQATGRWRLSARVYHRVLRISLTLADLAGRERVSADDVAEALQYRGLERPAEIGQKGNIP